MTHESTGHETGTGHETSDERVDEIAERAGSAFASFAATAASARADLLRAIASGVEERSDDLVAIAASETFLPEARLQGEVVRTAYQLRAFARLIEQGLHLGAVVEHADPDYPVGGPAPDLRSVRHPIGPVAVFAASNFPFAFSVAGGDTASALAVGCPVVVKAHPGHPELSRATADIIRRSVEAVGLDAGVFDMVEGTAAGIRLLRHPDVRAGAFTGSTAGGRALFDIAAQRPTPIPFFGELGSINPVFVTREATDARAAELAEAFVASYTMGAGQLCTKPGIVFVARGSGFTEHTARSIADVAPARLLNDAIRSGYDAVGDTIANVAGVEMVVAGGGGVDDLRPALARCSIETFLEQHETLTEERFGPSALVVEYDAAVDLVRAARTIDGTLTATIHSAAPTDEPVRDLVDELAHRTGRLIYNGWPTGVIVSPAMVHGGPYPATTAPGFTSVGATAIERFVRPVAYQNFPDELLPAALSDERGAGVPRQVDRGRSLR